MAYPNMQVLGETDSGGFESSPIEKENHLSRDPGPGIRYKRNTLFFRAQPQYEVSALACEGHNNV
jgi:hypothetical protein